MPHPNRPEKVVVRSTTVDARRTITESERRTGATTSPTKATQPANFDKDEFGDLG